VRGYADQKLRKPDAPLDPSNRRISLIVHYLDTPEGKKQDFSGLTGATAASSAPVAAPAAQERAPLQLGPSHH
jgi:chemotaxis protein MotB